jgi:CheY-like chemotaxis protein
VTPQRTILVVDDHPDHLYFFRRVLTGAGYAVAEAGRGEDVLPRVLEVEPDLIILDLVLPGLTGWDVATTVKRDPRTSRVPVFLVTAYPHKASEQWSSDGDCDALLVKPVDPKRLLAEVERWI